MSYKLNLKNPHRKALMQIRRVKQRTGIATPPRMRVVQGVVRPGKAAIPAYHAPPRAGNKYILSGPNANVAQPQNIIWNAA